MKISNITGVVLGGGQSRRMGRDKRRLEWDGQLFLDRVCLVMNEIFDEILVVTAHEDYDCSHLPVRLVTDLIPYKGSLGGLYTGLKEAKNSFVFVVACDMPFLNKDCIVRINEYSLNQDVLMVKLPSGIQPLHARYSKGCAPFIEEMILQDDLKIQHVISHPEISNQILPASVFDDIDPYSRSFMNINTPADLEFARKMARSLPSD